MAKSKAKKQAKPKLALYWAASCGGCEITIAELGMKLVTVGELVDIVLWPCIMDFKYSDVEAMKDGEIDICLFNGAIRTSENKHLAKLLRKKSKVLVAFGSCSHTGGIPGLANFYDAESILERVYDTSPSVDDSRGTRPTKSTKVPEGEVELPIFYEQVKTLAQTVKVDYFMPGCPPVVDQVWKVLQVILSGELPPAGSIVGADGKTNCDVCTRKKGESSQRIKEFKRPHLVDLDPETCFLTQGVICCGPATRSGCGLPCINGNMPCRGCYGPPDDVVDQGAKLISAIGALVDTDEPETLEQILDTVVDPAGLGYRFGLANSVMSELKYKKAG
ncbi:MAG: oxidoreductase [Chloroflexota bacterium]|nr:oxidoreductase [Chloroflexota bacterium]